jgi:transcriptional pleiotropic regulator of transition state genes
MKSTGIVRNIDSLGRIVIPKELRDNMDIHKQDEVEIFVNHNDIIIKKFKVTCVFCGSNENIIDFKNQNICVV